MTQIIYNSLKSTELDITSLSDPSRLLHVDAKKVDAFTANIAVQINEQRTKASPGMRILDLEDHITDVRIETTAQGAGILEVHVLDPWWMLFRRDPKTGASFIDVDEDGYLWPPIEVNFPPKVTDATWRLVAVTAGTDMTSSNVVLTFEDKIVSELREHDKATDPSCAQSTTNETRAEYIRRLVKTASSNKLVPGDVGIRFIPLLPTSVFTSGDLTADQTSVPASAAQPQAPPARKNFTKVAGSTKGATATNSSDAFGTTVGSVLEVTMGQVVGALGTTFNSHGP